VLAIELLDLPHNAAGVESAGFVCPRRKTTGCCAEKSYNHSSLGYNLTARRKTGFEESASGENAAS
jgi:hypothetical protein